MNDNRRQEIYKQMALKETSELESIWQRQDRNEWTDEALEIVAELLKERLGDLPQPLIQKSFEETSEDEEDDKFYHEESLIKIATFANLVAWLFIIFSVLKAVVDSWNTFSTLFEGSSLNLSILLINLVRASSSILTGFFNFIILKSISEGIYLFLDIEDNTHEILEELKKRKE